MENNFNNNKLENQYSFSEKEIKYKLNVMFVSIFIGFLFYIFAFDYIGISSPIFVGVLISAFLIINKIKTKNVLGIFFIIISFILSLSYSIYTNHIFRVLNAFLIPITLISSFLLLTYKNIKFKFIEFSNLVLERIFEKGVGNFIEFPKFLKILIKRDKKNKNINNFKSIVIGLIISIPIIAILLTMLISADGVFKYYVGNIIKNVNHEHIFIGILKLIVTISVSIIIFGIYSSFSMEIKEKQENTVIIKLNPTIIVTMLTLVSILYIAFTKIQITYLYFNKVLPKGFVYSEYARSGFFQLVSVVVINVVGVIGINKFTKCKSDIGNKLLKVIYSLITVLTFNMAFSALYKMRLYIQAFGFTRLRLLVSVFTVFLILVLILLLGFIWKNIELFKPIILCGAIIYIGLNFFNVDQFITKSNLELLSKSNKIDKNYLIYLSFDNYDAIIKGYKDGKISVENYKIWLHKNKIATRYWYEYNYFNSKGSSIES